MSVIELLRDAGVECYTRDQWGSPREADGSYARRRRSHPMPPGPAPYHFLHLSVTSDTDTVKEGAEGARQIETYGYSTPPMVSYQDLVTNEGRYYEGQSYGVKGTHTVNDKLVPGFPENLNLYGYATALMQNVWDEVTDEQVRVVAMIFAARELEGLVVRGAPVYPHRKFAAKSCPGDKAMARLDEIVRLKNQYVKNGLPGGEDMPQPKDLWNHRIPEYDKSSKPEDRPARVILSQAHNRAGDARRLAGQAARRTERIEKALGVLADSLGAEVGKAVRDALKDATVDVDVTVRQGKEES